MGMNRVVFRGLENLSWVLQEGARVLKASAATQACIS